MLPYIFYRALFYVERHYALPLYIFLQRCAADDRSRVSGATSQLEGDVDLIE
jgi:hypothetical protein